MAEETVNVNDLKELKERMKIIASADPKQFHNEFSLRRYLKAFKTPDAAFQMGPDPVTSDLAKVIQNAKVEYFRRQSFVREGRVRSYDSLVLSPLKMPSCVIKSCKNYSEKHKKISGITFHVFPRDKFKKRKRIDIVRKEREEEMWAPTRYSVICSNHFRKDDFYLTKKGFIRLNRKAWPLLQAILKTNKWRTEYGVEELANDAELIKKYSDKALVLRHRDIIGRPIIYIPAKNHNSSDRNIDELTKYIVYCLDKGSKMCFEEVVDNLCIVFDLNNFTLSCMDYQVLKNLIWLLSRHYPERLGVCLITNAPAFFSGCWAVIKGWLDENTASKVVFVNTEMDLCRYLIPDALPSDI